jgi:hypothetical protein
MSCRLCLMVALYPAGGQCGNHDSGDANTARAKQRLEGQTLPAREAADAQKKFSRSHEHIAEARGNISNSLHAVEEDVLAGRRGQVPPVAPLLAVNARGEEKSPRTCGAENLVELPARFAVMLEHFECGDQVRRAVVITFEPCA